MDLSKAIRLVSVSNIDSTYDFCFICQGDCESAGRAAGRVFPVLPMEQVEMDTHTGEYFDRDRPERLIDRNLHSRYIGLRVTARPVLSSEPIGRLASLHTS